MAVAALNRNNSYEVIAASSNEGQADLSNRGVRAGRFISGVAVAFMLFDGVMKLLNVAAVQTAQAQLGIPESNTLPIAFIELFCVLAYIVPRTAIPGAILLTGYLGGAIAIQLRAGSPLATHILFPIYVGALLWGGLYLRNQQVRQLIGRPRAARPRPSKQKPELKIESISRRANAALWSVQVLLAALFLFAGATKLLLPIDVLTSMGSPNQVVLPGWFLRFIGTAEVLGAIGLILPRLLRIRIGLTPLAAAGLVIIMIGATGVTLASGEAGPAIVPFVVGILATLVAYGRGSARKRAIGAPSHE